MNYSILLMDWAYDIEISSFETVFKAIFKQRSAYSVCCCEVIIVKDFVFLDPRWKRTGSYKFGAVIVNGSQSVSELVS